MPTGWNTTATLASIPYPPGDNSRFAVNGNCVVRTNIAQTHAYKIPLTPAALNPTATQTTANYISVPVPGQTGVSDAGPVGVATNGVPYFPNFNNVGSLTWTSCEVDACNAHSGRAADYHFHGDPYGCLYSATSVTANHPNLIGYSLDGYGMYGRHTTATQDNVNLALDSCGGHSHGTYGYHYHAQTVQSTTSSLQGLTAGVTGSKVATNYSYTAFKIGPDQCWAGNIASIPNFWQSDYSQPNYDRSSTSVQCSNDYAAMQPCCNNAANTYTASGITVNTVAGVGSVCTTTAATSTLIEVETEEELEEEESDE